MTDDFRTVLLTEEQIQQKVAELGRRITADYDGQPLVLVCLLKGAVVFLSDLMRRLDLPVKLDFMSVSSYGSGSTTSGKVKLLKDLGEDIEGRNVLIVEDILDSGVTLSYIKEHLLAFKPKDLKICALLDKPERRRADITADYRGFVIPDEFVVGYGLDYDERYRNLPFIAVLKPEIYS